MAECEYYWKYNDYIAWPDGDLAVVEFTFGANTAASVEDRTY